MHIRKNGPDAAKMRFFSNDPGKCIMNVMPVDGEGLMGKIIIFGN